MHAAITDHPEYHAIRDRIAAAERDRAAAIELGQRWDAEVNRLRAEHAEAVRLATEAGELPPPEPAYPARPDVTSAYNQAVSDREAALRDERAWLVGRSAELLAELHEAERALVKRAAVHVARLKELVPEWGELAETAAAIERAAGRRLDARPLTPAAIADAVTSGRGFVPEPPAGTPRRSNPERVLNEQERLRKAREKATSRRPFRTR